MLGIAMEDDSTGVSGASAGKPLEGWENEVGTPTPVFFVSVASKGLSCGVSLLFATLAGGFINVAAKGLTGADCWREGNGPGWEDFGGVRRTTWRADMGGVAPSYAKGAAGRGGKRANYTSIIAYWYS
jgi:hypothetical protein